ncbi:tRNA pseudouridine synthase A [Bacterioplanes sanyensis]|uniref:tRNA pseudouridine(38-40) synthase TruA n=1 Tax=Bacterioplanes sanyensis TaxID=1249553 RepID=UPI001679F37D|nr:tRNA pseudouridine(38-40) synthase TruA [Bacterioplanes sanyensis]GGY42433.1 tRNA pseudouridine synthase A [Bacterioplanes sanyensis]
MSDTQRYAAVVEYNGSYFHGWQRQKHHNEPTVQAALEAAISFVANHPVEVVCAGRTDAGVHACQQVIHFDTSAKRSDYGWLMGINTNLPAGVAVQWLGPVDAEFHARFRASGRHYRYIINNAPVKPALMHDQLTWWRYPLDAELMHEAVQALIGEHDFSAFRARDCQAHSPVKTMYRAQVRRFGQLIVLELHGSAFLYHMVRNIVGVLLPIGQSRAPVNWMAEVLASCDRRKGGVTAPAEGLYFVGVDYPQEFSIPCQPAGPAILAPLIS